MQQCVSIVEHLRRQMIEVAEGTGMLTHPDVVMISQRLDRILLQCQRAMQAARKEGAMASMKDPGITVQPALYGSVSQVASFAQGVVEEARRVL